MHMHGSLSSGFYQRWQGIENWKAVTGDYCQHGFVCIPPKYHTKIVIKPFSHSEDGLELHWVWLFKGHYPSIACDMFLHTLLFTNDLTNLAFGILHLSEMITSMMGHLKMAPWHSQSCCRAYQAYHRPSPLNERCNALSNSLLIPSWLLDQHRQGSRQQLSFISLVFEIELHVSDEYFRSLLSLIRDCQNDGCYKKSFLWIWSASVLGKTRWATSIQDKAANIQTALTISDTPSGSPAHLHTKH